MPEEIEHLVQRSAAVGSLPPADAAALFRAGRRRRRLRHLALAGISCLCLALAGTGVLLGVLAPPSRVVLEHSDPATQGAPPPPPSSPSEPATPVCAPQTIEMQTNPLAPEGVPWINLHVKSNDAGCVIDTTVHWTLSSSVGPVGEIRGSPQSVLVRATRPGTALRFRAEWTSWCGPREGELFTQAVTADTGMGVRGSIPASSPAVPPCVPPDTTSRVEDFRLVEEYVPVDRQG